MGTIDEKILATDDQNNIVSHQYHDQLATEEDLEKIRDVVVTYDKEETLKKYQLVGDAIGDILPLRLKGIEYATTGTWDRISELRGVTNLLIDLVERPEFMHQTVKRLHDVNWNVMKQYEALNLFDNDPSCIVRS
jgi:hypothetical protein